MEKRGELGKSERLQTTQRIINAGWLDLVFD
jgi:hypothetical protein